LDCFYPRGALWFIDRRPLIFGGRYLGMNEIVVLGKAFFFAALGIAVIMWFVFILGLIKGKYKNITEKDWHDQVW
jgi:hypothetical protein